MDFGDFVQPSHDAKGGSRNPDGGSESYPSGYAKIKLAVVPMGGVRVLTNIAPDWGLVNGIVGPDHGINELIEARECDPDHVVASSGVQCLKVPR